MISPREESAPPDKRQSFGTECEPEPTTDQFDNLLKQVRMELGGLAASVWRTAFLEFQRLHLKLVDGFFRGALYLCLLSAGIALSIAAALQLADGARGALAAILSVDWISDLAAGVLLVLIVGSGGRWRAPCCARTSCAPPSDGSAPRVRLRPGTMRPGRR
jgi:hypothetical protein